MKRLSDHLRLSKTSMVSRQMIHIHSHIVVSLVYNKQLYAVQVSCFYLQFNCSELLGHRLKAKGSLFLKHRTDLLCTTGLWPVSFICIFLLFHYSTSLQGFFATVCSPRNTVQHSVHNDLALDVFQVTTRALVNLYAY